MVGLEYRFARGHAQGDLQPFESLLGMGPDLERVSKYASPFSLVYRMIQSNVCSICVMLDTDMLHSYFMLVSNRLENQCHVNHGEG